MMKIFMSLLAFVFLAACQPVNDKTARNNSGFPFYVGTYTGDDSQGIYKYLLVANQKSGNIVSFERDKETGLLKYIYQTEAPSPVCILF